MIALLPAKPARWQFARVAQRNWCVEVTLDFERVAQAAVPGSALKEQLCYQRARNTSLLGRLYGESGSSSGDDSAIDRCIFPSKGVLGAHIKTCGAMGYAPSVFGVLKFAQSPFGFSSWESAAGYVTFMVEAAASQRDFLRRYRKDYNLDTRLTLAIGERFTGAEYLHAQRVRSLIIDEFRELCTTYDAFINPTLACTAPKLTPSALTGEVNPSPRLLVRSPMGGRGTIRQCLLTR